MTDWKKDREIIDKATPGPWEIRNGYCYQLNQEFDDALWTASPSYADGKFIAAARTRWPAALDRIAELEARLEKAEAVCRLVEGEHKFDCMATYYDYGIPCDCGLPAAIAAWRATREGEK